MAAVGGDDIASRQRGRCPRERKLVRQASKRAATVKPLTRTSDSGREYAATFASRLRTLNWLKNAPSVFARAPVSHADEQICLSSSRQQPATVYVMQKRHYVRRDGSERTLQRGRGQPGRLEYGLPQPSELDEAANASTLAGCTSSSRVIVPLRRKCISFRRTSGHIAPECLDTR